MLTRLTRPVLKLFVCMALLMLSVDLARADEPCGRGDCHNGFCQDPVSTLAPMAQAKAMPKGDGPTIVYLAPAPRVGHPLAAILCAVNERCRRAAGEVEATVQYFESQQPVRAFVREHRPIRNWQARRCGCR